MTLSAIQKKAVANQKEVIKQAACSLQENGSVIISGGAGYGKSYIASAILKQITNTSDKIVISTMSHQALGVAKNFIDDSGIKYDAYTNASLMQARKHTDPDGTIHFKPKQQFKYVKGRKIIIPPPISEADILLFDECSQLPLETLNFIDDLKKPNARIIFLGDIAQLPPINGDNDVSPVFGMHDMYELQYPFRYDGDNAKVALMVRTEILNYINGKKANLKIWKDLINFKSNDFKMFNGNNLNDRKLYNQLLLESFKNDEYFTKYISYHRHDYQKVAAHIRNYLRNEKYDFQTGDLVRANSNYYDSKGLLKIQNGYQGKITGIRTMKLVVVRAKDYQKGMVFLALHTEKYQSLTQLKAFYSQNYGIASSNIHLEEVHYLCHDIEDKTFIPTIPRKYNFVKDLRTEIFKEGIHTDCQYAHTGEAAEAVSSFFCDVQYAYGMTSHIAQGTTQNTVFTSLKDINSETKTTDLEKLQSFYVAATRATNKNYILY